MQISEALEGQAEEVGLAAGQRRLRAPGSQISRQLKCDSHRASPQEKGILCPKSGVSGLLKTLLVSKQGLVKWRRVFGRQATGTGSMNEQWGWQLAASKVTGTPCAVLGWSHQGWPSAWGKGGKSRAGKGGAAGHEETGHPGSRGVQQGGYGWA